MIKNNSLNEKRQLIVCADDFGMSRGINQAILELLRLKRITAVSCLVSSVAWRQGCRILKEYRDNIDIGLHLSYGQSFSQMLSAAYLGRADKKSISGEFEKQLNIFYKDLGFYPDFIDGHEHIHQLPVFRSAVIDLAKSIPSKRFYLRNSYSALNRIIKRKVSIFKNTLISFPGRSLKKALLQKGLFTNNDFLGIYDLASRRNFRDIFVSFLKIADYRNSIFVVHPSNKDYPGVNPCAFLTKRVNEAGYLKSDDYLQDLEQAGLSLGRFDYGH